VNRFECVNNRNATGFLCTTVSRLYKEWSTTQRTSSQQQASGRKWVIDERRQRRLMQIVQSNRQATLSQQTVQYNIGAQRPIKECTTRRTLTRMGLGSRRPYGVPLLSAKKTRNCYCSGLRKKKTLDTGVLGKHCLV
jgi:hypothetical protein